MKISHPQASMLLGEHHCGQLARLGRDLWGLRRHPNRGEFRTVNLHNASKPSGCINQVIYNEPDEDLAADINGDVAWYFDHHYRKMFTAEEFILFLGSAGVTIR